jgi:hypothetical protein
MLPPVRGALGGRAGAGQCQDVCRETFLVCLADRCSARSAIFNSFCANRFISLAVVLSIRLFSALATSDLRSAMLNGFSHPRLIGPVSIPPRLIGPMSNPRLIGPGSPPVLRGTVMDAGLPCLVMNFTTRGCSLSALTVSLAAARSARSWLTNVFDTRHRRAISRSDHFDHSGSSSSLETARRLSSLVRLRPWSALLRPTLGPLRDGRLCARGSECS